MTMPKVICSRCRSENLYTIPAGTGILWRCSDCGYEAKEKLLPAPTEAPKPLPGDSKREYAEFYPEMGEAPEVEGNVEEELDNDPESLRRKNELLIGTIESLSAKLTSTKDSWLFFQEKYIQLCNEHGELKEVLATFTDHTDLVQINADLKTKLTKAEARVEELEKKNYWETLLPEDFDDGN